MDDMVLSNRSDLEKLMRFAIDRLEKEDTVSIRASVEQSMRLSEFVNVLCNVFGCRVSEKKTGHFKSCGQHMKIIRYTISSNNLEFVDELKKV